MKLKSSRMRKAKDQIGSILNKAAVVSLHKDCSEAFSKKRELSTSGIISASRDERADLQDRLKDLQRQKSLIDARDARFEKEHKEARIKVDKQKRGLEKIVSDLSDKNVQIVIN